MKRRRLIARPEGRVTLAWVAVAALALLIAGAVAGVYTHGQNVSVAKKSQIRDLEREIAKIREESAQLDIEWKNSFQAARIRVELARNNCQLGETPKERKVKAPITSLSPTPDEALPTNQ